MIKEENIIYLVNIFLMHIPNGRNAHYAYVDNGIYLICIYGLYPGKPTISENRLLMEPDKG